MTQWNFRYVQDRATSDKKSYKPSCQPKKRKISAPRHDATRHKFSPFGWVLKGACDAPLPLAFSVDTMSTFAISSQLEKKLRLRKIQKSDLNFSHFIFDNGANFNVWKVVTFKFEPPKTSLKIKLVFSCLRSIGGHDVHRFVLALNFVSNCPPLF